MFASRCALMRARARHVVELVYVDMTQLCTFARLGADDVAYVTRLDRFSRALEIAGRALILRKYVAYYSKEYVLFPALAGPLFWKVLLGNWLVETSRNVYMAATILCGHVGDEVKSWPADTRARGRGEWYAMQVEASNDNEVSWPVSVLCGALTRERLTSADDARSAAG